MKNSQINPRHITNLFNRSIDNLNKSLEIQKQNMIENMATAKYVYHVTLLQVRSRINALKKLYQDDYGLLDWESQKWDNWEPQDELATSKVIKIGYFDRLAPDLILPTYIPVIGGKPIIFKVQPTGNQKIEVVQCIQSILLRLLATIMPSRLNFLFVDPIGLGQNVASFMALSDYDETIISGKAWTESQHIERQLLNLTEHMETVIQKYLRSQYKTIQEYNREAKEIAEPYRVLVVFDFPTNFTEDSIRRLISLAQQGVRCGIYTIIVADTTKPLPYGFNLAELEQNANIIVSTNAGFTWDVPDFENVILKLDSPPKIERFTQIVNTFGEKSVKANKVQVKFSMIAPDDAKIWSYNTINGIDVPLGPAGAKKLQIFSLGQVTSHNALIAGRVGSGKTNLMHVLITNACLQYSPSELQLYLIDFKEGVGFKKYAEYALPHARVIALESEREFGLSVLEGLYEELSQRGALFTSVGVDNITDYRRKTEKAIPRLLLIVDEFQVFFVEDDNISAKSTQLLDTLVRLGRAFGIHIVLGSQTLAGNYSLPKSTSDQMAVRIAMQCSEADSRLILGDDNPAARLLSRPGEAIYNASSGLIEFNSLFQVAYLPDEVRNEYLERIVDKYKSMNFDHLTDQIIFEVNQTAQIEDNKILQKLVLQSSWSTNDSNDSKLYAWLGSPVAIEGPIAASFIWKAGCNLLIVGRNEQIATGQLSSTMVSLAMQAKPTNMSFYIINFMPMNSPESIFIQRISSILPQKVVYGQGRLFEKFTNEVKQELDERLNNEEQTIKNNHSIFFIVYGLQKARELNRDYDYSDEPNVDIRSKFEAILREGPALGIHIIAWCDDFGRLTEVLDRRQLREFKRKIVSRLTSDDSNDLIGSSIASKLRHNFALFSDEDNTLKKFRPYDLPNDNWLELVEKSFHNKIGDFHERSN